MYLFFKNLVNQPTTTQRENRGKAQMIIMEACEAIKASSDKPINGSLVETVTLPVGNALQYLVSVFDPNLFTKIIKVERDEIIILVSSLPSDDHVMSEVAKGAFVKGPGFKSVFDIDGGHWPSYLVTITEDKMPRLRAQGIDALYDMVWSYLAARTDLRTNAVLAVLAE